MEPTTPSRSPGHSSFVVDIEKADDPYGEPAHLNSANTTPFTSPKAPFVSPGSAAAGPLIGLKNLIDRNPATIVSGRYTINLRQLFVLLLILMGLTTVWFVVNPPESFKGADESESLVQSAVGVSDQDRTDPRHPHANPLVPGTEKPNPLVNEASHGLTGSAKFRFERVRGKDARTSLKKIQFQFPVETQKDRLERETRLKAVRDGFEHAWKGYKKHAWGHDEVKPVEGGFRDTFNGWGATMVDSLDTLVIMGFNDEFDEALEWVRTQFDMTKNPTAQHQFFETVIRYLGGFLSTYDLTGEKVLLDKAEELGKYLLNAFQGKNFPNGRFAVQANSNNEPAFRFVLAEVGTIQLEFSRLSMLTKNPVYDTKARKIVDVLGSANPQLPGLLPDYVLDNEGQSYSNYKATVGGMVDSYYEYLLKEWILLDGKAPKFREMFEKAANSIKKYMVMRPENGSQDYAILGHVNSASKNIEPDMEHLACFMSGSLAMGAKYFDRPDDLVLARQVAQGCFLGYHQSATGLGPEAAKFVTSAQSGKFIPDAETFFSSPLSRKDYILRPETIESLWILYRLTGEKKYQNQAWEIFQSLEKSCRTDIAYTGLLDVTNPGSHDNRMESFFMAETMKYLYLMFSTPDVISLDDFVLNTEAHPILRT
ncbi:hypothetical protein BGZ96_000127 [Linnemannia gamsii]|uniref:alpha-1,2-Mannosidase n=1 Tax=Linnemannia gamsii TaxID=64522 RepID=A0ABQ7JPM3_9FUNG|nr:hypothetical protein BGZ96_000127 [Linnemannia gamsii]